MKRSFYVLGLLLLWMTVGAYAQEGPDDQYVHIYSLILQADSLNASGQLTQAYQDYEQAKAGLEQMQSAYPSWNPEILSFRIKYVDQKMAPLKKELKKAAPKAAAAPSASKPGAIAAPPPNAPHQIKQLQAALEQLTNQNKTLEAKLREALSAQPAGTESQPLMKAEGKISSLQKEVTQLKQQLKKSETSTSAGAPSPQLKEVRQDLEKAQGQLQAQKRTIYQLNLEKEALQTRLQNLGGQQEGFTASAAVPAQPGASVAIKDRKKLDQLESELKDQREKNQAMAAEKGILQQRLQKLSQAKPPAANQQVAELEKKLDGLQASLQQKMAALKAAQTQLASARQEQATLQQKVQSLQASLDSALSQLTRQTPVQAGAPVAKGAEGDQIRQLQLEKEALEQKLAAIQGTSSAALTNLNQGAGSSASPATVEGLRAQLAVLEAKKEPFSPEELALLSVPSIQTAVSSEAGQSGAKPLPSEAAQLVTQAQNDFAAKKYAAAEQKYKAVLKYDPKNVTTLNNLALVEMEAGQLNPAEADLKKALRLAPHNANSWSLLGMLKYRRSNFDGAFDALSVAALLDPDNAETQNYLGVTLSRKGLRAPAEAALRKAIELNPEYASAHYNLALVYATEKPPYLELARWHYQKAITEGQPRNPKFEKLLNADKKASPDQVSEAH